LYTSTPSTRGKPIKTSATAIVSVFSLLVSGSAGAHGDHPSTHGGVVGQGNDEVVVEFVVENGALNLYVENEAGEPLATEKLTGTLTLIAPHHPAQEVKLVSTGSYKFTAPGIEPATGDRLLARITLPSGEQIESAAWFVSMEKPGMPSAAGASLPAHPGATKAKLP
jgi:hypothetical protein